MDAQPPGHSPHAHLECLSSAPTWERWLTVLRPFKGQGSDQQAQTLPEPWFPCLETGAMTPVLGKARL